MNGMETVAEAVLVDALGPVGEILFEEVADLVRVARAGKDPVPDLPVGGVVETVPPVGAGGGLDHGAAGPGRVAQRRAVQGTAECVPQGRLQVFHRDQRRGEALRHEAGPVRECDEDHPAAENDLIIHSALRKRIEVRRV